MWRIHVAMDVTFIYIYDALFYIHNGIGFLMLTIVKMECVFSNVKIVKKFFPANFLESSPGLVQRFLGEPEKR